MDNDVLFSSYYTDMNHEHTVELVKKFKNAFDMAVNNYSENETILSAATSIIYGKINFLIKQAHYKTWLKVPVDDGYHCPCGSVMVSGWSRYIR